MHITYENYFEQIDFMRQEWKLTGIVSFNEKEFHVNSIGFFNSHHYHSEYGKQILESKKARNLNEYRKGLRNWNNQVVK